MSRYGVPNFRTVTEPAMLESVPIGRWTLLAEIELLEDLLRDTRQLAGEDDVEAVREIALSRALALRRQAFRAGFAAVDQ